MVPRRLVVCVILALALAMRVQAFDAQAVAKTLDDAAKLRESDKTKSRQMLDSVQRELAANPDPLLVARAQLLECQWADTPPVAYRAVATGLAAADRAGSVSMRAQLTACHAYAMWYDSKQQEAEREFNAAVELAHRANDPVVEADATYNLGELQYERGAMADALANLQRAYRIDERLGRQKQRLDCLTGIANVYADTKVAQFDRAIEYYRQLEGEYEKFGLRSDVADTLFNLGSTYAQKNDHKQAEIYYRRSLAAFAELKRPDDVAFTQRALGLSLVKDGRAREALPLLDAAVTFYEKAGSAANVAASKQYRGMAYRRVGRLREALQELGAARQYYAAQQNTRYLEKNVEETALTYAQLGDWKNAYETVKQHADLQQQLAASRRDELSSRLRVEFDSEKKEQENRALARENSLRSAALREAQQRQTLQRVVIVLTALLAIALALLFWRQLANTRRVRAMAMTDELTRLPNRRHILATLDAAFLAARRASKPITVIAFDIDRFKRINDTWGHAAGDTVLQTVARTCRLALRPHDQLGRTGGEEFLIVLHDATYAQAGEIAERLRAAVEQLDFSSIEPNLRVTISLGVWVTTKYDAKTAIAAADSLLYRAKESGRNRVEMEVAPVTS
ncbi:MAG TPA: tetratricopeptide repeat-containing diguanylate cyclase [Thermoanaerobaculia bacterium]|nr:tetratricopeptide repeat-containing diguanylate cyclase [Thermoanaerobaculia bacterium]